MAEWEPLVAKAAAAWARNRDELEDLRQDCRVALVVALPSYSPKRGKLYHYVSACLRNAMRAQHKRRQRWARESLVPSPEPPPPVEDWTDGVVARADAARMLERAHLPLLQLVAILSTGRGGRADSKRFLFARYTARGHLQWFREEAGFWPPRPPIRPRTRPRRSAKWTWW